MKILNPLIEMNGTYFQEKKIILISSKTAI